MLAPDTLLQGRYVVIRPLGQGGMGAVYEATDRRFGRTVAIKQAFYSQNSLGRAFEREARLLNDLRHPALPVVIDYFTEGSGWFLVMDFVPGDDLASRLRAQRGPFPVEQVIRWADQVLDALEYLHGHEPPIIHRDIKPQNLKVTARGEVRVLDFGLAKGIAAELKGQTSGTSVAGYTPHYAPIEQVQGAGTDVRSDLYALAATMYHLLTGRVPPDALERAMAQINAQPDPLLPIESLCPTIPPEVAEVIRRALAVSANQRPASAIAMRRALRDASGLVPSIPRAVDSIPPQPSTNASHTDTVVAGRTTSPGSDRVTHETADGIAPTHAVPPGTKSGSPVRFILAACLLFGVVVAGAFAVRWWTAKPEVVHHGPLPPVTLTPLKYDTITLDAHGAVVERRRAEAQMFVEKVAGVSFQLVRVDAGTFEMGTPKERASTDTTLIERVSFGEPQEPAPVTRPYQRERPKMARPRPVPENRSTSPEPEAQQRDQSPTKKKREEPASKSAPKPERPAVPELEDDSEFPQHSVAVPAFFLGRWEVTQAQWRAVAALPKVERDLDADPSEFKGDNLPVDNVSWQDATEFCRRLFERDRARVSAPGRG